MKTPFKTLPYWVIEEKVKHYLESEKTSPHVDWETNFGTSAGSLYTILFFAKRAKAPLEDTARKVYELYLIKTAGRNKYSISDGVEKWLECHPHLWPKWNALTDEEQVELATKSNGEIKAWFYDGLRLDLHRKTRDELDREKHEFRKREGIPCDCSICD